jgi:hypothetical protein
MPEPTPDLAAIVEKVWAAALAAGETRCDTDHDEGVSVHAIATEAVTPSALIALTRFSSATFTDFIPTCELWRQLDPTTVLTMCAALERTVELEGLMVDPYQPDVFRVQKGALDNLMREHDAALARTAELERALEALPDPLVITWSAFDHGYRVECDVHNGFAVTRPTLVEALIRAAELARERGLAPSAAAEEGERG